MGEIAATEVSTSRVVPAARALDVLGGERILRQARGHGGNKERSLGAEGVLPGE